MKQHFFRSRWKYLAVILLSVTVWCTVFSVRSKPPRNEILRVLYIGEAPDTKAMQQELTALLPELTEITVTQELPQGRLGGDWMTYRQFAYDIMIISAPFCTEAMGQNYFSRWTEELIAQFPGAPTYTETVGGKTLTYALRLSVPEGDCLLFFSPESVNLGGMNGKGSEADTAAITAAQFILEAYD